MFIYSPSAINYSLTNFNYDKLMQILFSVNFHKIDEFFLIYDKN